MNIIKHPYQPYILLFDEMELKFLIILLEESDSKDLWIKPTIKRLKDSLES